MTDRVGRHAAAPHLAETLIIPAQKAWPSDDATAGLDAAPQSAVPQRAVGRHASGRAAAGESQMSPDDDHQAAAAPRFRPLSPDDQAPAPGLGPRFRPLSPDDQAPAPDPAARRRPPSSDRKLRLVWVYPDLLSTYGDRGNLLVLTRRAQLRGIEVEASEVNSDQPVPSQGDIYLLGGGEDLPQILAANRLRADGGLARAADRGAVVFAVCAGYQVMGDSFGGVEGEPVAGLGILDISSGRGDRRGVGELVADVDPSLGVPRLTGFENHQGITQIGSAARPLATVSLGVGNGDGTEGAYGGKVLGTYLHGPALARNPGLADLLLSWVAGQLRPIDPDAEEWASRLRAERLAAVGH